MMPALMLVGFPEGLLSKPWNVIGVGLVTVCWTVAPIFQGNLAISDHDAVVGTAALVFANSVLGMIVATRLRGIIVAARLRGIIVRDRDVL